MKLPFVKMHGLGNDFVVLDGIAQPLPDNFDFVRAATFFCDHHFGIGSDGLLLLGNSDNAEVQMRMWNPDGSEDMCGNGLRCIVALAHARGYASENFKVQTLVGVRQVGILDEKAERGRLARFNIEKSGRDARAPLSLVRVEMGTPRFALNEIPFAPPNGILRDNWSIEYELPIGDVLLSHVSTLSTGSTHTVIFGPHPDEETFQKLSPLIENHPWFPLRTSIMWADVTAENEVSIRIWERGAGETLACGTGACATAIAAQITGRAQTPLQVRSKGGRLIIDWQNGQSIWKTGSAQMVFTGSINWPKLP